MLIVLTKKLSQEFRYQECLAKAILTDHPDMEQERYDWTSLHLKQSSNIYLHFDPEVYLEVLDTFSRMKVKEVLCPIK